MSEFDQIAGSILLGSQAINNIVNTMSTVTFGWQTWTPTITPAVGAFGSITSGAWYFQVGPLMLVRLRISVISTGTATPFLTVSLPFALNSVSFLSTALSYADDTAAPGTGYAYTNSTSIIMGPSANTSFVNGKDYFVTGIVI